MADPERRAIVRVVEVASLSSYYLEELHCAEKTKSWSSLLEEDEEVNVAMKLAVERFVVVCVSQPPLVLK